MRCVEESPGDELIADHSIASSFGRGPETRLGQAVVTMENLISEPSEAFKFENRSFVPGEELDTLHLGPAGRPLRLTVDEQISPGSGADIKVVRETSIDMSRGMEKTEAVPARHGIVGTKLSGIDGTAAQEEDPVRGDTLRDECFCNRQKRRAAATGTFVHHKEIR